MAMAPLATSRSSRTASGLSVTKDLHSVDVFLFLHPVHEGAAQDWRRKTPSPEHRCSRGSIPADTGKRPASCSRKVDVEPQEVHLLPPVTGVSLVKTMDSNHDNLGEGQTPALRIGEVGTDHGDPAVVDMDVFFGPQDQGQGFLTGISQLNTCS